MVIVISTKTPKQTALRDKRQIEKEGVSCTLTRYRYGYKLQTIPDVIYYEK